MLHLVEPTKIYVSTTDLTKIQNYINTKKENEPELAGFCEEKLNEIRDFKKFCTEKNIENLLKPASVVKSKVYLLFDKVKCNITVQFAAFELIRETYGGFGYITTVQKMRISVSTYISINDLICYKVYAYTLKQIKDLISNPTEFFDAYISKHEINLVLEIDKQNAYILA